MSAATESQRDALRSGVGTLARACAESVSKRIGRDVRIALIICDLHDKSVYTGACELVLDELIDVLRSTLEAIETNNHSMLVSIGDEIVLDRGKPS